MRTGEVGRDSLAGNLIGAEMNRVRNGALAAGVAILALCAIGGVANPPEFFRAYLIGVLYWLGLALGCLSVLMMHHLVNGRWGFSIQRILEAGVRTLPLTLLFFLPLLLGLRELYAWARPGAAAAEEILRHKAPYLNVPFFLGRAVLYFAVWLVMGWLLTRWSVEQDRTADPRITVWLRRLSGPGLVLYGLTMTFASIDWVMSTEIQWFSTIFGAIFLVGQTLAALGFATIVGVRLAGGRPLGRVLDSDRVHDLGNMILAFVVLWAYMAFAQYLITWSGNLPDEIVYYLHRTTGGWEIIAILLGVFYFGFPFALLLLRAVTRHGPRLVGVAVAILIMRALDIFWMVEPSFHPGAFYLHWLTILVPVGLGGIWLGAFLWLLQGRPLLALHDPRFAGLLKAAGESRS
ncbi:MAG TPA: hypothetical protein VMG58_07680 [Candidatus Sulfotelmatobacter sp.]|nr:hypothetical protein [Candidatus Sulfotelmatobacter sp.]